MRPETIIFPILALVFLTLFILYWKDRRKKIDELGRFLKMPNRASGYFSLPSYRGEVNDREVSLTQKSVGRGKYKKRFSLLEINLDNKNDLRMDLSPEFPANLTSFSAINNLIEKARDKVKELAKVEDILIGDPGFDKTFVIKGQPSELIKQILSEDIRYQMLGLKQSKTEFFDSSNATYFSLTLNGNKIIFKRNGHSLDKNYYGNAIKMLFALIDRIENTPTDSII